MCQEYTDLGNAIVVWEKDCEHGADSQEVLNLESINVGIMRGFVVVEHEINDVGRGSNEEKFERSEV